MNTKMINQRNIQYRLIVNNIILNMGQQTIIFVKFVFKIGKLYFEIFEKGLSIAERIAALVDGDIKPKKVNQRGFGQKMLSITKVYGKMSDIEQKQVWSSGHLIMRNDKKGNWVFSGLIYQYIISILYINLAIKMDKSVAAKHYVKNFVFGDAIKFWYKNNSANDSPILSETTKLKHITSCI
ncbi:hypothetical protein BpHYR1_031237 [Brachionus plicatilis]|uniref:Uncharacterized protein n=1 Tax=Brachionus plicatilis TaxID=10195 RepID=A0A3M7S0D0_BRAPC|nr:hypothetical protein BpHYR1_031237 [Brachionus plicatilis]